MKKWSIFLLAVVLAGCQTVNSTKRYYARASEPNAAAVPSGPTTLSPEQLGAIKAYKFGGDREPLTQAEDVVRTALASTPKDQQALANQLAGLLGGDSTPDGKLFACRQLALVGTEQNVAAIAPLLNDPKTSDMARYALQPIPGAKVDAALIAALKGADRATEIGIINTLGDRKAKSAAKSIESLSKGTDASVAAAATAALEKIHG